MPKYFDGLGNDRTHYVNTLAETAELYKQLKIATEETIADNKKLSAENKRLRKKLKE